MIDELEEKRQKRRDTREGLIRWVKSLRDNTQAETRAMLSAQTVVGVPLSAVLERVLGACTDEDIVDMLALLTGSHLHGELVKHLRSVQFVETEAERIAREASPLATAYAKMSGEDAAWFWGALSNVWHRAPMEGHPAAASVMEELFALFRARGSK